MVVLLHQREATEMNDLSCFQGVVGLENFFRRWHSIVDEIDLFKFSK